MKKVNKQGVRDLGRGKSLRPNISEYPCQHWITKYQHTGIYSYTRTCVSCGNVESFDYY